MGLDGFSISQLGLHRDLTSAQLASQADEIAKIDSEQKIEDITTAAAKKGIRQREGDGSNGSAGGFSKFYKENQEEDELGDEEDLSHLDFSSKDPKDFGVRVNPRTEMVELYNIKTKKIVEAISAGDLMQLIARLNGTSSILVNKRV